MSGEFYESLYRRIFRSKIIDGNFKSFSIQWQDWVLQVIIAYVICFWNSKKIKDGSTPIVTHFFFNVVAKLGNKRLSESIFIDMGTEKFSDWCDWSIFRDSLIIILLTSGMSLLARNRARNVSGKSIPSSGRTQRINVQTRRSFL